MANSIVKIVFTLALTFLFKESNSYTFRYNRCNDLPSDICGNYGKCLQYHKKAPLYQCACTEKDSFQTHPLTFNAPCIKCKTDEVKVCETLASNQTNPYILKISSRFIKSNSKICSCIKKEANNTNNGSCILSSVIYQHGEKYLNGNCQALVCHNGEMRHVENICQDDEICVENVCEKEYLFGDLLGGGMDDPFDYGEGSGDDGDQASGIPFFDDFSSSFSSSFDVDIFDETK